MFQPDVCNGCHYVFKMSMHLSNIAILINECADYCWIISGISKMQNIDLTEKGKHYKT